MQSLKKIHVWAQMKVPLFLVASLDIILSDKRITKSLISLRGCAGWSTLCCSQTSKDRFSRVEAHIVYILYYTKWFSR